MIEDPAGSGMQPLRYAYKVSPVHHQVLRQIHPGEVPGPESRQPGASRLALAAACTLLLVLAGFLPADAATSPIHPANRPTPLPGESNGRVSSGKLIAVEGECRTVRAAAPSLARLLAAARADGVPLVPSDCYRPYDGQAAAFNTWCGRGQCACAGPPGTSMHGWGKAVDFRTTSGPLNSFTSPAYRWLKANAGRYGWNHPGWAEPGGGPCPEAWHWEWVGDGGTMGADPVRADVAGLMPTPTGAGYWVATALGGVVPRGDARSFGAADGMPLARLVVGSASHPGGRGYWLAAADGGIFAFGEARFLGSTGGIRLNRPIVGMAAIPTGNGYWTVASDGGVFAFGEARFLGSTGGLRLNQPIAGMASTRTGNGYWIVAWDGGIFAFGDARFLGSTGGMSLAEPIVGMAATPSGNGYWLVGADGGVFSFGDAVFHGSTGFLALAQPIVGMAATPSGRGYWLVGADGAVFSFGDAVFFGTG